MAPGAVRRVVLALAVPATTWAFGTVPGAMVPGHGAALRGAAQSALLCAPPRVDIAPAVRARRGAVRGAAPLRLAAEAALAVDPEAAWAQHGAGDSSLLASIVPELRVLTPDAGVEVTVGEVVGSGKGLVVFMRHVG